MSEHSLTWSHGKAQVLSTAAMLAQCTFKLASGPFSPFARAPWMGTIHDRSIIGHLREMGGDFVGVPFGTGGRGGEVPAEWSALMQKPATYSIHGPSADEEWEVVERTASSIRLRLDYPKTFPVAYLERTISGRDGATAIDFELAIHARRAGKTSVGLHPNFRLPDRSGDMSIDAEFAFGLVHPGQTLPGQSQEFTSLAKVPQGKGFVDLTRPPLAQPNLNVQLCGMQGPLTATYHQEGAGFVLDWDRALLPSLQIWHTDRGIDGPPWHGQYRGLGLEPIAAAFDFHDDASTGPNPINRRGIATAVAIQPDLPIVIGHSVTAFTAR